MEAKDRLLLPVFEPPVTRNPAIMLVDFAVAFFPFVEFLFGDRDPSDDLFGRQFGAMRAIKISDDRFIEIIDGNVGLWGAENRTDQVPVASSLSVPDLLSPSPVPDPGHFSAQRAT